eukprot:396057-Amphidinium_carterae.1
MSHKPKQTPKSIASAKKRQETQFQGNSKQFKTGVTCFSYLTGSEWFVIVCFPVNTSVTVEEL